MIYAIGESLMDIIFDHYGQSTATPGGGMLNTAVSLGRRGHQIALISELGDDHTASLIIDFLSSNKVNTKYIRKYYQQNTSIAIAHLDVKKRPSFSIYKTYPAKRKLVAPKQFQSNDIVVFGSIYSIDPLIRSEIIEIIVSAKQSGAMVIYDPNIRKHNLEEPQLKEALDQNLSFADIVKGSDEDFENLFGKNTPEKHFTNIRKFNQKVVFILTMGEKGVAGFNANQKVFFGSKKVDVKSTIGAGDAFSAGIIHYIQKMKRNKSWIDYSPNFLFEDMVKSGLDFSAEVCASFENYVSTKGID